ncbi:hypothetical protein B0H14DRAFT_3599744 [Mycena olivaceomarginata]|nr:hypothetical protein B0H14DRAFT_3599744 [Mycena olivaceomarginata]
MPGFMWPRISGPICVLIALNLWMHYFYVITVPPGFANDPPVADPAKSSAESSLFWAPKKATRRGELAGVRWSNELVIRRRARHPRLFGSPSSLTASAPYSGPPTLSGPGLVSRPLSHFGHASPLHPAHGGRTESRPKLDVFSSRLARAQLTAPRLKAHSPTRRRTPTRLFSATLLDGPRCVRATSSCPLIALKAKP